MHLRVRLHLLALLFDRPIRKKLKALNKKSIKITDQRNKAVHQAGERSINKKEQMELDDARRDNSCTICMASFRNGQAVKLTPCGHAFHSSCFDPWLTNGKNHCPSCSLELLHTSKDDD